MSTTNVETSGAAAMAQQEQSFAQDFFMTNEYRRSVGDLITQRLPQWQTAVGAVTAMTKALPVLDQNSVVHAQNRLYEESIVETSVRGVQGRTPLLGTLSVAYPIRVAIANTWYPTLEDPTVSTAGNAYYCSRGGAMPVDVSVNPYLRLYGEGIRQHELMIANNSAVNVHFRNVDRRMIAAFGQFHWGATVSDSLEYPVSALLNAYLYMWDSACTPTRNAPNVHVDAVRLGLRPTTDGNRVYNAVRPVPSTGSMPPIDTGVNVGLMDVVTFSRSILAPTVDFTEVPQGPFREFTLDVRGRYYDDNICVVPFNSAVQKLTLESVGTYIKCWLARPWGRVENEVAVADGGVHWPGVSRWVSHASRVQWDGFWPSDMDHAIDVQNPLQSDAQKRLVLLVDCGVSSPECVPNILLPGGALITASNWVNVPAASFSHLDFRRASQVLDTMIATFGVSIDILRAVERIAAELCFATTPYAYGKPVDGDDQRLVRIVSSGYPALFTQGMCRSPTGHVRCLGMDHFGVRVPQVTLSHAMMLASGAYSVKGRMSGAEFTATRLVFGTLKEAMHLAFHYSCAMMLSRAWVESPNYQRWLAVANLIRFEMFGALNVDRVRQALVGLGRAHATYTENLQLLVACTRVDVFGITTDAWASAKGLRYIPQYGQNLDGVRLDKDEPGARILPLFRQDAVFPNWKVICGGGSEYELVPLIETGGLHANGLAPTGWLSPKQLLLDDNPYRWVMPFLALGADEDESAVEVFVTSSSNRQVGPDATSNRVPALFFGMNTLGKSVAEGARGGNPLPRPSFR